MKKLTTIAPIIILIMAGTINEIYCQSKSNFDQAREYETSLEVSIDNYTATKVIYTKPNRSLTKPDIQMIAKFASLDSIDSYRFRIEIFTQRKVYESDKVFIKSSSGIHVFDTMKDNSKMGSKVIDVFINWGCCYQSGCMAEGYIYTFILETFREDFIKIISSSDLKVIFYNLGNPDLYITHSDISKMNDLYYYLKATQNVDLKN